ncbi:MAG: helix-turn-helix domain-containing protein [Christensenellales bacterium]
MLLALSYIRRNFTQEISLTQLSEYVYANASVLSRDFGAEVGMTLTEYVAALRVERAKRLLAENERTIEKSRRNADISGAKYFREQFKRLTGLVAAGLSGENDGGCLTAKPKNVMLEAIKSGSAA